MSEIFSSGGDGQPIVISGALAAFWLGYALILIVPGPNMLFLSAIAATRGVKAALPSVLSVSLGSVAMIAMLHLAARVGFQGRDIKGTLSLLSALLFLFVAWRILHAAMPSEPLGTREKTPILNDAMLAFFCSVTNPVTGAYCAAAILGGGTSVLRDVQLEWAIAGVMLLATIRSMLIVLFFSHPKVRAFLQRFFVPLKQISAALLALMSLSVMSSHVSTIMP